MQKTGLLAGGGWWDMGFNSVRDNLELILLQYFCLENLATEKFMLTIGACHKELETTEATSTHV